MSLISLRRAATMFAAVATIVAVNTTSTSAQAADPKWEGTFKGAWTSDGPSGTGTLTIAKDGANLKVSHLLEGDQVPPPSGDPRDWKAEGNGFSFAQTYGEFEVMFKGTVEGDVVKGTIEAYQGGSMVGSGSFEYKRQ
ncbi:MAG TPA: hypothetical protein VJU15_04630 [Gemmatimonadales bacterium]|nr:hypothetical protein [Gemmatimonadales bacterium]